MFVDHQSVLAEAFVRVRGRSTACGQLGTCLGSGHALGRRSHFLFCPTQLATPHHGTSLRCCASRAVGAHDRHRHGPREPLRAWAACVGPLGLTPRPSHAPRYVVMHPCLRTGVFGEPRARHLLPPGSQSPQPASHSRSVRSRGIVEGLANSTTFFFNGAILDHFRASVSAPSKQWSQRYYVDQSVWCGAGCPVFVRHAASADPLSLVAHISETLDSKKNSRLFTDRFPMFASFTVTAVHWGRRTTRPGLGPPLYVHAGKEAWGIGRCSGASLLRRVATRCGHELR